MSSSVEAGGIVAAAVMLPVAAAYGAGWIAWQGGKLIVEANRTIDRQIEENKRQKEEQSKHRKIAALSAHRQIVDMCSQILVQLESEIDIDIRSAAEVEQMKRELRDICDVSLPEEVSQIESINSLGYLKMDKVIRAQRRLATMTINDSDAGLYHGLSVAAIMEDMRVSIETMQVNATTGTNVMAANPDVLERVRLNEEFASTTAKIVTALQKIEELSTLYKLSTSEYSWFKSCFNGIDLQIEALCAPSISNQQLKKGVQRIHESLSRFEMMLPEIERELEKRSALYKVYVDASRALGEEAAELGSFKSSSEIENRLKYYQNRAERAQICAEIYKKLGRSAYMCYAWDQELQKMGYEVHSRKKISEMSESTPVRAQIGNNKLPFYKWNKDELTQMYSITSSCNLQVIVHDDGTVSMQTIAETSDSKVVDVQKEHCSQMNDLRRRLRDNWFIKYDYAEIEPPQEVTTVSQWKTIDGFDSNEGSYEYRPHRERKKNTEDIMRMR